MGVRDVCGQGVTLDTRVCVRAVCVGVRVTVAEVFGVNEVRWFHCEVGR